MVPGVIMYQHILCDILLPCTVIHGRSNSDMNNLAFLYEHVIKEESILISEICYLNTKLQVYLIFSIVGLLNRTTNYYIFQNSNFCKHFDCTISVFYQYRFIKCKSYKFIINIDIYLEVQI
jgi:hypothetical protein